MDNLVYHYLDVMDQLGLDRPHVVGASFGGWIAAELAVAAPHRIGSLVLLAPAGLRLPEHPVADLFIMSPEQVLTALFHDPAAASGLFPAEARTWTSYWRSTATWRRWPGSPGRRSSAIPNWNGGFRDPPARHPGRLPVRRPAHPGRAPPRCARAHPGSPVRRDRGLRPRDVLRTPPRSSPTWWPPSWTSTAWSRGV